MNRYFAQSPEEKTGVWSQRQTYLALGFLLQTAALLKVDTLRWRVLIPQLCDQYFRS